MARLHRRGTSGRGVEAVGVVPGLTLPELFEAQVARTPDAVAVVCEGARLSYAELDGRANRLARYLVSLGAGPERLVAVVMPRSADMIVAVLAVLKAGAAYLPIEPDYPADRVAFMLDDARPRLMLASRELAAARSATVDPLEFVLDAPGSPELLATFPDTDPSDADRVATLRGGGLAYVIYTSGSTGRPKGVAIEHDALSLYLDWACDLYPSVAGRALLHSPLAFDLTVTALFCPLISGGCVHLATLDPADAPGDGSSAGSWPPTFVKVTPSHLPLLSALPAEFSPTGHLVVGGELLLSESLTEWRQRHPSVTVVNEYGPTETTVGCSVFPVNPQASLPGGGVPIGDPTPETEFHILDDALRPVPVGVAGELYVSGGQLARGYLNRPALTAGRFVANPFGPPGSRMYRTGDTVRRTFEGELESLGRADDQAKFRGYRIELGEVESVLTRHGDVVQAAAVVGDDHLGGKRLLAYVVPAGGREVDLTVLRQHASEALPDYMVPAVFVSVRSLPLTPNGKLDRKALPPPPEVADAARRAPRTPREELLCALFAQALGIAEVPVDGDFFALGGSSVLAVRLAGWACEAGVTLTLRSVFDHRTPERLAALPGLCGNVPPSPRVDYSSTEAAR